MKKKGGVWKFFLFMVLVVLVLFLVIFGARIWLFFKFLLGNDVLMTINADKTELNLKHGETEDIAFDVKVTANLFCKVDCTTRLRNIGTNEIIEEETSSYKLGIPLHKSYTVEASSLGEGQDLYRFEIECTGQKTYLCDTSGDRKSRSFLFRVLYTLSDEEKKLRDEDKLIANNLISEFETQNATLLLFETNLAKINKSVSTEDFYEEINLERAGLSVDVWELEKIKDLWGTYDYASVHSRLKNLENKSYTFNNFNVSFYNNITLYNNLTKEINSTSSKLEAFKAENVSSDSAQEIDSLIEEFNYATNFFSQRNKIEEKKKLVMNVVDKLSKLTPDTSDTCCLAKETINDFNFSEILFDEKPLNISSINIVFEESGMQCNVLGKKGDCCLTDECKNNRTNFPILFLHGHDFSSSVSADYSVDVFNKLSRSLEEDENYLNVGELYLKNLQDTPAGFLSMINTPITLKVSYYFDVMKNIGSYTSVQTKSESIDTYALRLNDIITEVKRKTNKPKVVLVTHSMGGLVARKYIDIFGTKDIEKIILIAAPNHGISGNVAQLCSVFGESIECNDMKEGSLLINKLNNAPVPNIPVYNIIGTGCVMDIGDGDGIVSKASAEFGGVENFFFNGTCTTTDMFHSEILDNTKYPEVYNKLRELLKR